MLGAVLGDICGSTYERRNLRLSGTPHDNPYKSKDLPLFENRSKYTDDSVLTIALADHFISGSNIIDLFHIYFSHDPDRGFGEKFGEWCESRDRFPYNSWGNGSAMRTSTCGYISDDLEICLKKAEDISSVTHNHPEAIHWTKAVTHCIFLARTGHSKEEIFNVIDEVYDFELTETLDEIRPDYSFLVAARESVPYSISAFLQSKSYEDAIRNVISLGGDSDTMACITGSIAEAFYKDIPEHIILQGKKLLPLRYWDTLRKFYNKYNIPWREKLFGT